jgi:hypothetical protein
VNGWTKPLLIHRHALNGAPSRQLFSYFSDEKYAVSNFAHHPGAFSIRSYNSYQSSKMLGTPRVGDFPHSLEERLVVFVGPAMRSAPATLPPVHLGFRV